ncbi:hypothetical protein KJ966_12490 [bacterium]|nr:hypothetical protein [bacterium]
MEKYNICFYGDGFSKILEILNDNPYVPRLHFELMSVFSELDHDNRKIVVQVVQK